MLHLAFAAGLRVSELVSLRLDQIDRQHLSNVHIIGKGRRERVLPVWKKTAAAVKAWLKIRGEEVFEAGTRHRLRRSVEEQRRIIARGSSSRAPATVRLSEHHGSPAAYASHTCGAGREVSRASLRWTALCGPPQRRA